MKGFVLDENYEVSLQEVEKPAIEDAHDVLIKVKLTTLCGSDVHLKEGVIKSQPPFVLGHEYLGEIVEVGDAVEKFKVGDFVAGPPAVWCGMCSNCASGKTQQCKNGGIFGSGPTAGGLSGAMSEYMRIPYADTILLHVPEGMDDTTAISVCDIFNTGYFALDNVGTTMGDKVAVFGAGPVGLSVIASAQLFGAGIVIAVEPDAFRRETALKLGADYAFDSDDPDLIEKIFEVTDGEGCDVAAECAGSPHAFQNCCLSVGAQGRVSVVGIGDKMDIPCDYAFNHNITIKMGLGYLGKVQKVMDAIAKYDIDLSDIWTHEFALDDIEKAWEIFENRQDNVIKIAIRP